MPSGSYRVASRDDTQIEGSDLPSEREPRRKVAGDRVYKNCCILLLAFAVLFMIIIAITWPFAGDSAREDPQTNNLDSREIVGESPVPLEATTNENVEVISTMAPKDGKIYSSPTRSGKYRHFPPEATSSDFITTEQTTIGARTSVNPVFPEIVQSSTPEDSETPKITNAESTTSPVWDLLFNASRSKSSMASEESTPAEPNSIDEDLSSTADTSDSSPRPSGMFSSAATPDDRDFTSLKKLLVARYFGNDSSSTEDPSNDNWLDDLDKKATTKESRSNSEYIITSTPEYRPYEATHDPMDSSTQQSTHPPHQLGHLESLNDACTGKCRQKFSKMLSWMNHSADPCEDFYEFACGGLEADPEMIIISPEERALSIINKQMRRTEDRREYSFYTFYKHCVAYAKLSSQEKRRIIDDVLNSTQSLFEQSSKAAFTQLMFRLWSISGLFLFDINLDIDEFNPHKFILNIGPSLPTDFSRIFRNDSCDSTGNDEVSVDLDDLYGKYKLCWNNTKELMNFLIEIRDSRIGLEVFNGELPLDFIKTLLSDIPPENEIREAYRAKNYTLVTVSELQKQFTLLDWSGLLQLTNHDIKLQVYFKDYFLRALRRIDDYGQQHFSELMKAIHGISLGNLYNQMVNLDFSRDLENKCLKISSRVLPTQASYHYMSAFTGDELNTIKLRVSDIFKELKQTLKSEFEEIHWVSPEGRDLFMKKLDDIKISIPELSHFNDELQESRPTVPTEFLWAAMVVELTSKSNFGELLKENPNTPKLFWPQFATAFQPLPRALHPLNTILLPLGALEPLKFAGKTEINDYATLASVGNLLAHEIARFFDEIGIRYWNGTRDSLPPLLHDNNFTTRNYESYVSCQRDEIFQYSSEITIPGSNQLVKFRMPPQTLNERLCDAAGVRLAHDTLDRLGRAHGRPTPWLDFNVDQLFYIAYAQTHCTKAPLTASSVSLHENPQLPGRLRVSAAAMSNRRIGETFNCAEGSQLLPAVSCGVFPYLEVAVPTA